MLRQALSSNVAPVAKMWFWNVLCEIRDVNALMVVEILDKLV